MDKEKLYSVGSFDNLGKCCSTCKYYNYQYGKKHWMCYKNKFCGEEVCEYGVCENWEE